MITSRKVAYNHDSLSTKNSVVKNMLIYQWPFPQASLHTRKRARVHTHTHTQKILGIEDMLLL